MNTTVELPLWFFILILLFGLVTFASHFLFPSVRWFFRRRMERLVDQLNERLERPIEPFKLAQRYDMIQRLIYDPDVSRAIADHAAKRGLPENVAFEQARRYAREIVPSFSAWLYFRLASRLARWLSRSTYDVEVLNGPNSPLDGLDSDATVVLVMNHRSNIDYVLLTYLMASRGAISFAVGEWARVWPLGPLVRLMGAYFIRRRQGNDLYREILSKYIYHATRAGVTQAVFPEGGLSLTGALAKPRVGLLKYIVDAAAADVHDDEDKGREVIFVPVALNYDRILEDHVLLRAAKMGRRRFGVSPTRALRGTLRLVSYGRKGRKRRYGQAGLRFGDPLVLSDHKGDVPQLGEILMQRIETQMPVSATALAARLLLKAEGGLSRLELELQMKEEATKLPDGILMLPNDHFGKGMEQAITVLTDADAVEFEQKDHKIKAKDEEYLQFCAASIVHFFRNRSTNQ